MSESILKLGYCDDNTRANHPPGPPCPIPFYVHYITRNTQRVINIAKKPILLSVF